MIMNIDIEIVKFLQSIGNKVFDYIFYFITQFGDMYFFILLLAIIYWTIDKRFAYKLLIVFTSSALFNTIIKVIVKRARPYDVVGIESKFTKTTGYSFPSGHSQASGVIFYNINKEYGKTNKVVKILVSLLLILVPLSRVYLGQHYLSDVIVGILIGLGMSYIMFKVFDAMKDKEHIYPLFIIPVIIIAMFIFKNQPYDKIKELFVAGGGLSGFIIGYYFEKLYVKHDVSTTMKNKVFKVIIGLIGVGILYFGLKSLFPEESLLFDSIRYFSIAIYAALFAPYIFVKIFNKKN